MLDVSYRGVEVVLAEQSGEFGDLIAPALMAKGIRDLVVCRDAHALHDTIDARQVDVILCDIELPGLKFRDTVQRIRRNEIGQNPFVQIVATMNESARPLVRQAIGAGIDDLIRKPMPMDRVLNRFEQLTKPRRPFAITESFIGPNRRQGMRPGENVQLVQVPHSLRHKLVEQLQRFEVQQRIDRSWREVAERKSRVKPEAIYALSDRVIAFFHGKGSEETLKRDLRYLVEKSEELILRCEGIGAHHLNELATSMRGVVRGLVMAPENKRRTHARLMPDLTRAAHLSLAKPDDAIETVVEIARAVRDWLDGADTLDESAIAMAMAG
ncbi:MAG TPA: response regulator [Magnetospirillaceae bacterium]|jgi:DNA-binding response OmpR family regulator